MVAVPRPKKSPKKKRGYFWTNGQARLKNRKINMKLKQLYGPYFKIEKIMDCRTLLGPMGGVEYLVKWADYGDSENSWEPAVELPPAMILKFEQRRARGAQDQHDAAETVTNQDQNQAPGQNEEDQPDVTMENGEEGPPILAPAVVAGTVPQPPQNTASGSRVNIGVGTMGTGIDWMHTAKMLSEDEASLLDPRKVVVKSSAAFMGTVFYTLEVEGWADPNSMVPVVPHFIARKLFSTAACEYYAKDKYPGIFVTKGRVVPPLPTVSTRVVNQGTASGSAGNIRRDNTVVVKEGSVQHVQQPPEFKRPKQHPPIKVDKPKTSKDGSSHTARVVTGVSERTAAMTRLLKPLEIIVPPITQAQAKVAPSSYPGPSTSGSAHGSTNGHRRSASIRPSSKTQRAPRSPRKARASSMVPVFKKVHSKSPEY